ncbi:von willebrand factor type A domain-containing protein [Ditylenchus destructor]|uniref:von willebrand factor type A domain-containing protein n=1 Tax=Ditylenchus destructor TaxID=166010 RepID=A0AAD4R8X9_9BILA|nr:von willebrand factor type A domain-containing protein [Ditylenchus destructor]
MYSLRFIIFLCCYISNIRADAANNETFGINDTEEIISAIAKNDEKQTESNGESINTNNITSAVSIGNDLSNKTEELHPVEVSAQLDETEAKVLKGSLNRGCVTDTIFVVDSTGSVRNIFDEHRNFVERVVELLNVSSEGDHVALLIYSGKLRHRVVHSFNSVQNKERILQKVRNLPYMGGVTSTGVALDHAFLELKNGRRAATAGANVVIVTDGFSYDPVDVEIRMLRGLPAQTLVVSLPKIRSESELLTLAGAEANIYRDPEGVSELAERLQNSCHQNNIKKPDGGSKIDQLVKDSALPSNQDDVGLNTVQIRDKANENNRVSSNANQDENATDNGMGVAGAATGQKEKCDVNIVFVFDASGSLKDRFQRQLKMATGLMDVLPQSPAQSHVGVVKFSGKGKSRIILPMNNPLDNEEIKNVILNLQFFGGTTYANEGLEKASAQLTLASDSNKSIKMALVFTDGFSQEDISLGSQSLQDEGAYVFSVAINDQFPVNKEQLRIIASENASRVFMDKNYDDLTRTVGELAKC